MPLLIYAASWWLAGLFTGALLGQWATRPAWLAGIMLLASSALQWRMRFAPCPLDPALRTACLRTRKTSARLFGLSVLIYLVGGGFAFVLPWLMSA